MHLVERASTASVDAFGSICFAVATIAPWVCSRACSPMARYGRGACRCPLRISAARYSSPRRSRRCRRGARSSATSSTPRRPSSPQPRSRSTAGNGRGSPHRRRRRTPAGPSSRTGRHSRRRPRRDRRRIAIDALEVRARLRVQPSGSVFARDRVAQPHGRRRERARDQQEDRAARRLHVGVGLVLPLRHRAVEQQVVVQRVLEHAPVERPARESEAGSIVARLVEELRSRASSAA